VKARASEGLGDRLSERDQAVLADLERFRLLTTKHIQRLHFAEHDSLVAAARACNRALLRLRTLNLIGSLERRVGGVRRGSASFVWQLAAQGERLLRVTQEQSHRRRYLEPGEYFVKHTLAVAELAVGLLEAARQTPRLVIEELVTEPRNWRRYLGPAGETQWLKPDLYVVASHQVGDNEYDEEHSFLEIDLGTEHLPRIQAKCQTYVAYMKTGAYQAVHGLFPAVVWLSPNRSRRAALTAAVAATRGLPAQVFQVASPEGYLARLAAGE
jgi:hypothetical protein